MIEKNTLQDLNIKEENIQEEDFLLQKMQQKLMIQWFLHI